MDTMDQNKQETPQGTEIEFHVFLFSFVFIFIGIIGIIAKAVVTNKNNMIIKLMRITGVIGLLMLPLSFGISYFSGRLNAFLYLLKNKPSEILKSIFTGKSMADTCYNGRCSTYCCESSSGSEKWKDCDPYCSSKLGVIGVRSEKNDCTYDLEIPAVCKFTGKGEGVINYNSGLCNSLPSNGPVTCFCCIDGKDKWWDCNSTCEGRPELNGVSVDRNVCIDTVHRVECKNLNEINDDMNIEIHQNQ